MASRAGVLRARSGGQFFLEVQYYAILSATGAAHPAASGRTITPAAAVGPQAVLARLSSSTARSRSLAHIRGRGGFGVMGSSGSNADGAAALIEPAAWAVAADGGLVGRRWFASQLPVLHSQEQDGPPDEVR